MMLFLGILALVAGTVLSIIAAIGLMSLAVNGHVDGKPLRVTAGVVGIILLLTTTTWVAVTTINHYNAPYTMCGASNIQEDS